MHSIPENTAVPTIQMHPRWGLGALIDHRDQSIQFNLTRCQGYVRCNAGNIELLTLVGVAVLSTLAIAAYDWRPSPVWET